MGTLALAAGIILSCGQLDVASGAVFSLLGMGIILWANILPAAMAVGLGAVTVIALLSYAVTVWLIVRFRVQALLCTLAVSFIAKSVTVIAYTYSKGVPVLGFQAASAGYRAHLLPEQLIYPFSSVWLNLAILAVLVVCLWFWRYRSDWGIKHIAVGLDPSAATLAGITRSSVYGRAFLVGGLLVALSSITFLLDASQGAWSPEFGWGRELTAIAAAVVGGTRITGGRFDPVCIALAAVLIHALRDAVNSMRLPPDAALLLMGLSLLVVGVADAAFAARASASLQTRLEKRITPAAAGPSG